MRVSCNSLSVALTRNGKDGIENPFLFEGLEKLNSSWTEVRRVGYFGRRICVEFEQSFR